MPLAFQSISHGTIAFGFFNIDSDMLLLDRYFFFAPLFCRSLIAVAEGGEAHALQSQWEVYRIETPQQIGDLMGAIHGIHYSGFLGDVYLRFPFPQEPEAFKQKPDGHKTREEMTGIIEKYGSKITIPFVIENGGEEASIGDYRFSRKGFQELIQYVWQGGYPRWKEDLRPDYVLEMKESLEKNREGLFKDLKLT